MKLKYPIAIEPANEEHAFGVVVAGGVLLFPRGVRVHWLFLLDLD